MYFFIYIINPFLKSSNGKQFFSITNNLFLKMEKGKKISIFFLVYLNKKK